MISEMEISEQELHAMIAELDERHLGSMPGFRHAVGRMTEEIGEQLSRIRALAWRDATRRNFLRGGLVSAGALGGGLIVAACGTTAPGLTSPPPPGEGAELRLVRVAAALEVLAVTTYDAALQAAAGGALGKVPPAVSAFAITVRGQHADHRDSWNTILTRNGRPAQTDPDPKLSGMVQDSLGRMRTVVDLATLALRLENVALETYTAGAPLVVDRSARLMALAIAPVEAQHAAILNFVLGNYPVPDRQVKNDQARRPEDLGS